MNMPALIGIAPAEMKAILRFLARGPVFVIKDEVSDRNRDRPMQLRSRKGKALQVRGAAMKAAISAGFVAGDPKRGLHLSSSGAAALKRDMLRHAYGEDDNERFRAQHHTCVKREVKVDDVAARVTVNLDESPLGALMRMKNRDGQPFLPQEAFEAGERLRADFTRAHMQPRISANWEAVVTSRGRGAHKSGEHEISESAMAARLRVERALKAVGPELSDVLLDVCCFLKGLTLVERERQWPARSAKLLLRAALLALSRHYLSGSAARRARRA